MQQICARADANSRAQGSAPAASVVRWSARCDARDYRTTTLTSCSGTTTTLTTSLPSMWAWTLGAARHSASSSSRARARRRLDAVADLAVDLADELVRVALQVAPGRPPATAPPTRAGPSGARRRRRRCAARTGTAARPRWPARSAARRATGRPRSRCLEIVVGQLHDRGDRRVEGEAAGDVVGDLVDRPVRLAQQLEIGARRARRAPDGRASRRRPRRSGATGG